MKTDFTNVTSLEYAIEALKAIDTTPAVVIEKLTNVKNSYAKKSSADKKPTERQLANDKLKSQIIDLLESDTSKKYTVSQIMKLLNTDEELTNQRTSRLLTDLYDKGNGVINRTEDKRVALYFAKA